MSVRKGLTTEAVVDAALAVVEADGASALTLSRVARDLGVEPPSLYNHIGGLEPLRREVALRSVDVLAERLGAAAMGRSGTDALLALARAFRSHATEHPGLYELTSDARRDDEEYQRAASRTLEPVLAVLRGFGLEGDAAIHATRALRSALHGFVSLESIGGFGLDVDVDESFAWLVEQFATMLGAHPARS